MKKPDAETLTHVDLNDLKGAPAKVSGSHGRWLWIGLSLMIFGVVVAFLTIAEDTIDVEPTSTPAPEQLVSVETVTTGPQSGEVSTFAEVRARWTVDLSAAVSGRVTAVMDAALAGEPVNAGTTLITIEDSRFVAELAAAELAVEQAQLALWRAKNATEIARREFKRNEIEPPNDLALKLPQLEIAQSTVETARARQVAAKQQLGDATIVAPFSAFVTKRIVSPGQTVNVGDTLLRLVDNSTYELEAGVGRKSWNLLKKPLTGLTAKVLDQDGNVVAEATIRRGGGFLDERQYKVYLEIDEADANDVLFGDFVRLLLPGITVDAALDIPASALTQEGNVWYVDAQDRLQRFEPEVLFRRQDRVIITSMPGTDVWRIAITPLVSYLPGQKVRVQTREG